ncbi:MAG TPA: glucosamine-6-phosphate deaminase [Puia sp.]|nr:glucosamine-6-phosphate deaminase [Puia sp.]
MQSDSLRDNIRVRIFDHRSQLGEAAAQTVADTIRQLQKGQQAVNMIFAAAPSQNEFLAALCRQPLDWSRINAFHMDEYLGPDPASPQSFGHYLRAHLFDKVSAGSVHFINGSTPDPAAECRRYAALLDRFPTDIVCMGIGENNHLAFNDPPVADFRDPEKVKVVELDADCRQQQVNDGCFPTLAAVPKQALTLTIPALMQGRYIFAMVPGERKAAAIANTFNNPVTERYPSTIVKQHAAVQLFLDRDSSKLI